MYVRLFGGIHVRLFRDEFGDFSIRNTLITTAVSALVLFGGYKCHSCGFRETEYSRGYRIGVITRFSQDLDKKYEGEMLPEGTVPTGNGAIANVWYFSIDNKAKHGEDISRLVEQINSAAMSGKKVKMNYIEVQKVFARDGIQDYVQSVEPLDKK
jgi:hypothetical protein